MAATKSKRAKVTGSGLRILRGFGAGAAAAASITITGIKPGDEIISVYEYQPPTAGSGNAIKGDRTAEATIFAADTIKLSTTNTTGNQVEVLWLSI